MRRLVAGPPVVIAAHEHHLEIAVLLAPAHECGACCPTCSSVVNEVTQKYQA